MALQRELSEEAQKIRKNVIKSMTLLLTGVDYLAQQQEFAEVVRVTKIMDSIRSRLGDGGNNLELPSIPIPAELVHILMTMRPILLTFFQDRPELLDVDVSGLSDALTTIGRMTKPKPDVAEAIRSVFDEVVA